MNVQLVKKQIDQLDCKAPNPQKHLNKASRQPDMVAPWNLGGWGRRFRS